MTSVFSAPASSGSDGDDSVQFTKGDQMLFVLQNNWQQYSLDALRSAVVLVSIFSVVTNLSVLYFVFTSAHSATCKVATSALFLASAVFMIFFAAHWKKKTETFHLVAGFVGGLAIVGAMMAFVISAEAYIETTIQFMHDLIPGC